MAWTAPSDHGATIVTQNEYNQFHGSSGNCQHLKDKVDANEAAILIPMKAQGDGGSVLGGRNKLNFISGTNLVATVADDAGNDRINVTLAASGSSLPTQSVGSGIVTLTTAGSQGVKGAYSQLIASVGFAVIHIVVMATQSTYDMQIDIGVGAAGAEAVKLADLAIVSSNAQIVVSQPFSIPINSRISARAANMSSYNVAYPKIAVTVSG